jgi:hypothetical protein
VRCYIIAHTLFFGHTLKAQLVDPPGVGLLDCNNVVVNLYLLTNAREVSEPMNQRW